jgi:hypothetical protein
VGFILHSSTLPPPPPAPPNRATRGCSALRSFNMQATLALLVIVAEERIGRIVVTTIGSQNRVVTISGVRGADIAWGPYVALCSMPDLLMG